MTRQLPALGDGAGALHRYRGGWVVILIVVVSWVLYRFAAPKGWREWAGAGLVQAFIIALYAEMYGFPLTIYLLVGFFGIDLPLYTHSGHLWASLLGYGMAGALIEMLLGGAFIIVGLVLLIKGWRAVHHARREGRLAAHGIYGLVRHPQYSGILLAVFGQIVHWPTIVTVALFPVIVFVYVRLAHQEEKDMLNRFGAAYQEYLQQVPMFFPRSGNWGRLWSTIASPFSK